MSAVPCTIEQTCVCIFAMIPKLISVSANNVKITFAQPEKAVAPGQVAVVWDQDWCLGCGIIAETFP